MYLDEKKITVFLKNILCLWNIILWIVPTPLNVSSLDIDIKRIRLKLLNTKVPTTVDHSQTFWTSFEVLSMVSNLRTDDAGLLGVYVSRVYIL